ncbi:hypothetical protein CL652_01510 [bacterium]|nr:hypothetical protein [bacterium]|tara:strand:- start:2582 stop:3094 length:513 start_codon:yes stop_codon:yes gene_type:complete
MDFAKELYKKWWVIVIAIVIGGLIGWFAFNEYKTWQLNKLYREEVLEQTKALAAWKAESERLRNLYKKDTYGGETPEETLQLFISAMKAEDYELASKYYLPEQQEDVYEELAGIDEFSFYLKILETYDQEGALFQDGVTYEIEFFKNGEQKHLERFKLNEYTGKWKLEDY